MKFTHLFLLLIVFAQTTIASATDSVVEEMRQKIDTLGLDHNFAIVNLALSDEELQLIDQIHVDKILEYSRFGDVELLNDELPKFLRSIGNEEEAVIENVTTIISRTASQLKEATQQESAWICVRAFTPNPLFDIPRWHYDGYFFLKHAETKERAFKFAATLKGNHTLFYPLPLIMRDTFDAHSEDREYLSKLLDPNQVIHSNQGEGAFFLVGDEKSAAVHSEPKMDRARLFFSIVMGTAAEIQELFERWHQ